MRRSKRDAIFATSLYREKYYTELAEERQTTPGLWLKKLGITNKSETRQSPCWILPAGAKLGIMMVFSQTV